ncbi:MAG: metal-dependent transcriptional regulator [Ignavibacteriaceae bacterium]|nr:metal-dependent transcriptional regulator [Ignavibacteriaceae bacterium]
MEPVTLLTIGVVFVGFAFWLMYPGSGIIAKMGRRKQNREKENLENALKFIYKCEYEKKNCSLNGLAGNLKISADMVTGTLETLSEMKLIEYHGDHFSLTQEGRSYALRIIRIHRIWEKYLSERTSVHEKDWHYKAEEQEHIMSISEADALAEKLGNPIYDPHGDPIPQKDGSLPPAKSHSLNTLKAGDFGRVTHIEDEPQVIYEQILAQDIRPGMQLRVLSSENNKVTVEAEGDEKVFSNAFAANINVKHLHKSEVSEEHFKTLATLKPGDKAVIAGISKKVFGLNRRRLLDLGFVPGTEISCLMKSPSGEPTAYIVKGATIALRDDQVKTIFIR